MKRHLHLPIPRRTPNRTVRDEMVILERLGFEYGGRNAGGHHLYSHPEYGSLRPMSSTPRNPMTWRRRHRSEVAALMGLNLFQFHRLLAGQPLESRPSTRRRRSTPGRRRRPRKALTVVAPVEEARQPVCLDLRAWRLRCATCAYPVNHEGVRPGECPRCGGTELQEAA